MLSTLCRVAIVFVMVLLCASLGSIFLTGTYDIQLWPQQLRIRVVMVAFLVSVFYFLYAIFFGD